MPVRIGRLHEDEARFLAHCLILGAGIEAADVAGSPPPWRRRLMAGLLHSSPRRRDAETSRHGDPGWRRRGSASHRGSLRSAALPSLPDRLRSYYGDEAELAAHVLDAVATAPSSAVRTDDVASVVALVAGAPPPGSPRLNPRAAGARPLPRTSGWWYSVHDVIAAEGVGGGAPPRPMSTVRPFTPTRRTPRSSSGGRSVPRLVPSWNESSAGSRPRAKATCRNARRAPRRGEDHILAVARRRGDACSGSRLSAR